MRFIIYAIGAIVGILFLYFVIKFALRTNFSISGSEKILPVIAALCFGLYFLITTEFTAQEETEIFSEYASIILKGNNAPVTLPIFLDRSDPNISSLRFYFGLPINTMNLPLIFPDHLTQIQLLDVFEYCFLNAIPFSLSEGNGAEKINLYNLAQQNTHNAFLNYPLKSLQEKQNEIPNGPRTNISFLDQLKEVNIFLPAESKIKYEYQPDMRSYQIIHPQFKIDLRLQEFGILNIRPDNNRFHSWIVSKLDAASNSYDARKLMVFVTVTKSKYFQYSDQKAEFEAYFKNIKDSLKREYSWSDAEKLLKDQYLTNIAEETLDHSRTGGR